jgi:hypothetical protein
MAKKQSIPSKLQVWLQVRKHYHLTDTQIQMARELGLNPKKFGGYANHRQESWKRPLGEFIEEMYFKRFKKPEPDRVLSIEEQAEEIRRNQAEKKERKRLKRATEIGPSGKTENQNDQQAQKQ